MSLRRQRAVRRSTSSSATSPWNTFSPENPGPGWETFAPEDRLRDTTRVGNLTPLEHSLNVGLGAADYDRKRAVYQRSGYALTRGIVAKEWTPATLRARQEELANLAVGVWRVESRELNSNG